MVFSPNKWSTYCFIVHGSVCSCIYKHSFFSQMTKKKKITSSFSFPCQLNMGARLDGACKPELLYDLSAVLIHKGSAATSGHYVARIKDENSGLWWEFDDETVIKLGHQPFGESSSVSSASAQSTPSLEELKSTSNGVKKHQEIFSPTDAYMLIYCCTGSTKYIDPDATNAEMMISDNISAPPMHLSEEIEKVNASLIRNCRDYQSKKDALISHITEHRREVKEILSEAPVHSIEDQFFWVSLDWLRQWADNVDLPWTGQTNFL